MGGKALHATEYEEICEHKLKSGWILLFAIVVTLQSAKVLPRRILHSVLATRRFTDASSAYWGRPLS